jgi:hypothetical protein
MSPDGTWRDFAAREVAIKGARPDLGGVARAARVRARAAVGVEVEAKGRTRREKQVSVKQQVNNVRAYSCDRPDDLTGESGALYGAMAVLLMLAPGACGASSLRRTAGTLRQITESWRS